MSGILETVQQQLSGGALQQISQQLRRDPWFSGYGRRGIRIPTNEEGS